MSQLFFSIFLVCAISCGPLNKQLVGEKNKTQAFPTIVGSLASSFGPVSELSNWKLLLFEKNSGIGHLASLETNGSYKFYKVNPSHSYSMLLFTPDFQLASTLAMRLLNQPNLASYFSITDFSLPALIYRGLTLDFIEYKNLIVDKKSLTNDLNTNGIPDGIETLWNLQLTSGDDSDKDGLIDIFDRDDDSDGVLDNFDYDSNQDNIPDIIALNHDAYWQDYLYFWTVSLEKQQGLTEDASTYFLNIIASLRESASFHSIKVIGPPSVLNLAKKVSVDALGQTSEQDWNSYLFDDGQHYDRASGDHVYGVKLKLAGKLPRKLQALFVNLTIDDPAKEPYEIVFGQLLPDTPLGTITINHDGNGVITRAGEPFGASQEYVWSVLLFDATNSLVYSSGELAANVISFSIPEPIRPKGEQLSYKVVISSIQRVLSLPSLSIHSSLTALIPEEQSEN